MKELGEIRCARDTPPIVFARVRKPFKKIELRRFYVCRFVPRVRKFKKMLELDLTDRFRTKHGPKKGDR